MISASVWHNDFEIKYSATEYKAGDYSNAPEGGDIVDFAVLLNGKDLIEVAQEQVTEQEWEAIQETYRLAEGIITNHLIYG